MALSFPQFTSSSLHSPIPKTPTLKKTIFKPITLFTKTTKKPNRFTIKAGEERQQEKPTTQDTPNAPSDEEQEQTELGNEIKKAMMEREAKKQEEEESLFGGVAAEIGKIEWPAFNKVLGTTGVVLGVIAGSSVVLLTLNAVLAELSDRVFAGRGVQDFFG